MLALVATLCVFPFALIGLGNGKLLLGGVTLSLVVALWINALALRLGRAPLVPVPVLFLIVFATLAAALADNVQTGVLWAYPAALLFHFIIERRLANIFNGTVVVMTVFFAYAELGPALTLRMAAALTLTILVANVYSYASEIEQQQTMRQSQRADLLVRATMAATT